jgi:TolA-binding protein
MVEPARVRPPPQRPRRAGASALAGLLAAGLGLAGCAGAGADQLAIGRMESELTRLRAQNAALSERVDALEIRADGLRARPLAEVATTVAPRENDRPELEVVRLVPAGAPQAKATPIEDAPAAPQSAAAAERAELAASEFARAESLFAAKKYDAALGAFAGFVVRFPEHPRANLATLRRGECYFHKGEPARAAEHLEAALSAAPDAPTAPDALALLARASDAAGDEGTAQRARRRLRDDFPDHPAAKKIDTREKSP